MDYAWRVKQRRADEHLARFATACARYVEVAKVCLRSEKNLETGAVRVRLQADSEPPLSLGATIGDVLHNLRSALDAVAWEACKRGGVAPENERHVYFPITMRPAGWDDKVGRMLPALAPEQHTVFRSLQPWYWDEQARAIGVKVGDDAAEHDPLARLHKLANIDRHRVPHPVLARAGHQWLGHDGGGEVHLEIYKPRGACPGEVFVEWRLDPPSAAASADPEGEVILALNDDDDYLPPESALQQLRAMQQAVARAIQRVEIEVLGVVTGADLAELADLEKAHRDAQDRRRAMHETGRVVDPNYIDRYSAATAKEEATREAYLRRWRELFA